MTPSDELDMIVEVEGGRARSWAFGPSEMEEIGEELVFT